MFRKQTNARALPSSDKNYFNNSTCHVQEGEKQRKRNKRKTMNRGEGNRFIKFGHTIWTNFNNIINYFHHLNKAFFLLPLLWKEELWEKSFLDWSLCLWYSAHCLDYYSWIIEQVVTIVYLDLFYLSLKLIFLFINFARHQAVPFEFRR